jgi:DNA-binding transcriptional MerR regulator
MSNYSIKKLAKMAGVSVRTLHHYDHINLLVPSVRTGAGYRLYGEEELIRLQQILFYKELGLSLQEIGNILDEEGFDTVKALELHRAALEERQNRIAVLLTTIDKTIKKLQGANTMLKDEELYEGFAKEDAAQYRKEAIDRYGEDAILRSEKKLKNLSKEEWEQVKQVGADILAKLQGLMNEPPESNAVQEEIKRHYEYVVFMWGRDNDDPSLPEAYAGLAQLYLDDERYTMQNGNPNREFAVFLNKAMKYYAGKM